MEELCSAGAEEDASVLLQMPSAANALEHAEATTGTDTGSQQREEHEACFVAFLQPSPRIVPFTFPQGLFSSAFGRVHVKDMEVLLELNWYVPGTSEKNPVLGVHIHAGNSSTNGPIVLGFCGGDPLPAFSGACRQEPLVTNYKPEAAACNLQGGLCIDNGETSLKQAAALLASSKGEYYLNLHTLRSLNVTEGLGLIRGQLRSVRCS